MSHEIANYLGQDAIAFFGDTPWHGLGKPLTTANYQDLDAVMIEAGLDWEVERYPLYAQNADGTVGTQNPFAYGVRRTTDGATLSAIGPETNLAQNREAFSIVEPLLKEFGYTVEVAGALGNGSRVWLLIKAPQTIQPVPGDIIHGYLTLRHSHDNSSSLEGIPTRIRQVCRNTEEMVLSAAGGHNVDTGRLFRIKKTSGIKDRIAEARKIVVGLQKVMKEQELTLAQLADRRITPQETALLIEGILPLPRDKDTGLEKDSPVITDRRKAIANLIFTSPGASLAGADINSGVATAYAFLNSVSYYFDHVRPSEAKSQSAVMKAQASAIFGANNATKLLAFAAARKLLVAAN